MRLSGLFQTNVSDMHRGDAISQTSQRAEAERGSQSEQQAKELIPGRAIRGEIVGKNGQEIQIRIAKDVVINARMEQDIQASAGQNVTFEVRSNTSGVISLRPLFQNMSQENNALKALVQAGVESDAKSMQMVSTMMQEGMSIGKDAILEMYKQVIDLPEASVADAVQLSRLQIPVTAENLQQFAAYKNYEHQLLSAFTEVADELPQAVSELFAEGAADKGNALIGRLLSIFDTAGENVASVPSNMLQDDAMLENVMLTGGSLQEQRAQSAEMTESDAAALTAGGALEEAQAADMQITANAVAEDHGSLHNIKLQNDHTQNTDLQTEAQPQEEAAAIAEKDSIPRENREQLSALIKNAGGSQENAARLLMGDMGKEELYQLVRTLSGQAETKEAQHAVKELFVSKEFQQVLKEKLSEQWSLHTPEQLEKQEISKLYERLHEQTRELTSALSEAAKADSPLFKSVQNIRENVEFMNQLNQFYSYVQLPLKFNESSAHGDLYVYTNKKNLAKKDGSISAFLHLDMAHLGMVDVYVAMEQERISTNFYLEDEKSLELLENNMDILTKRLTDKGYTAQATLTLRDQQTNVMEEIVKTDRNISIISEQSFDVRA